MSEPSNPILALAVALGIGLLIGGERERRKGSGPSRSPAGVRTFALVSLAGAIARLLPGSATLVAGAVFVAALIVVGYLRQRTDDPGVTSEVALFVTFLLGALAVVEPALAAGLATVVAILLAMRDRLHHFLRHVLTEQELHDALLFTAAALVLWPLLPDRPLGPIRLRVVWRLVVIVMAISSAGYVALRALGPRFGLPIAGLIGGFVSSSATIAALGARAKREPRLLRGAVAGAVFSTVATVIQLTAVLWATSPAALASVALSMTGAGAAALLYGVVIGIRAGRDGDPGPVEQGRAFDPRMAVGFAAIVTAVTLLSSWASASLGPKGLLAASALAGFADVHAAAISVASLVAAGTLPPEGAVMPILAAFLTNTVTKSVLAASAGSRAYAFETIPGLLLVAAMTWAASTWAGGMR